MKYRTCLPWNGFFATRVYLWENLPVRLATQRKFNLPLLASPFGQGFRFVAPLAYGGWVMYIFSHPWGWISKLLSRNAAVGHVFFFFFFFFFFTATLFQILRPTPFTFWPLPYFPPQGFPRAYMVGGENCLSRLPKYSEKLWVRFFSFIQTKFFFFVHLKDGSREQVVGFGGSAQQGGSCLKGKSLLFGYLKGSYLSRRHLIMLCD